LTAVAHIDTPVGELLAAFSDRGLAGLFFARHRGRQPSKLREMLSVGTAINDNPALVKELSTQLDEYFAGRRKQFDVPLDLRGSPHQHRVWEALTAIPYGSTLTYGELAGRVESNARAVGSACGANPVSIIVPCHRVVGSDGRLRGYGGGIEKKRFLLELEGALQPSLLP